MRVTPEEIALAAAALEAKRNAEHSWHETTLPIEEAIRHLGLNATSQELAPEVVALRAKRAKQATFAARERQELFSRQVGNRLSIRLVLVILIGIAVGFWPYYERSRHTRPTVSSALTTLPIQKLSSVPDNVLVHIDVDTLLKLAKGDVIPENVSVDTRVATGEDAQSTTMFNNEWSIVKSKGELLVKGWATVEFALNISNTATGGLFSARPGWLPANTLVPVQVPAYRLERQETVRYLPDGKLTDQASLSVMMG